MPECCGPLRARGIELRQQRRQGGVDLHCREAGIVHVQYDTLGIFHETHAVLGDVGSSSRRDARISKNDAAAAVSSLDAPEKRALVLRVGRFACERNHARGKSDEMATAQRHDAARRSCACCGLNAQNAGFVPVGHARGRLDCASLALVTRAWLFPHGHSCSGTATNDAPIPDPRKAESRRRARPQAAMLWCQACYTVAVAIVRRKPNATCASD